MIVGTKGLLAALLFTTSVGTATAQEITLRTADSLPVGHYIAENVLMPLMSKTKELTGGRVGFQHFPAQQLGKAKTCCHLFRPEWPT